MDIKVPHEGMRSGSILFPIHNLLDNVPVKIHVFRMPCLWLLQTAIIAFAATVLHRAPRYGCYERAYQDTHHDIYDEPACKPLSNLCRDKYCKWFFDLLADISVA